MKLALAARGDLGGGIHATSRRKICFTEEEEDWRRLPAKDAGVDDDAMEKKKKATQFPDFEHFSLISFKA